MKMFLLLLVFGLIGYCLWFMVDRSVLMVESSRGKNLYADKACGELMNDFYSGGPNQDAAQEYLNQLASKRFNTPNFNQANPQAWERTTKAFRTACENFSTSNPFDVFATIRRQSILVPQQ